MAEHEIRLTVKNTNNFEQTAFLFGANNFFIANNFGNNDGIEIKSYGASYEWLLSKQMYEPFSVTGITFFAKKAYQLTRGDAISCIGKYVLTDCNAQSVSMNIFVKNDNVHLNENRWFFASDIRIKNFDGNSYIALNLLPNSELDVKLKVQFSNELKHENYIKPVDLKITIANNADTIQKAVLFAGYNNIITKNHGSGEGVSITVENNQAYAYLLNQSMAKGIFIEKLWIDTIKIHKHIFFKSETEIDGNVCTVPFISQNMFDEEITGINRLLNIFELNQTKSNGYINGDDEIYFNIPPKTYVDLVINPTEKYATLPAITTT